jgi:branched-chain amino acid transport system permease protein
MATIAAAELIRIVIGNWDFVGAAVGLMGPAVPRTVLDLSFRSAVPYYYIFLAVLFAVLAVTWALERGRMGYYWRAIRASERAARSLGVPVRRYKLYALLLSAAFTSLAGSLYALMVGFVDPESGFGILVSVEMIITAALGGIGTLLGPLLGAAILVPLKTATNTLFGGGGSGLTYILYGGIILLLSRFEPGGLLELWRRLAARRGKVRLKTHAA